MLIYYLDQYPSVAANSMCIYTQLACINTYTQILSNAHYIMNSDVVSQEELLEPHGHNNTYSKWVCEGKENYLWLARCTIQILNNYASYSLREHARRMLMGRLLTPPSGLDEGWTNPPLDRVPVEHRLKCFEKDPNYELSCHRSYYVSILEKYIEADSHPVEFIGGCPDWMTSLILIPGRELRQKEYKRYAYSKGDLPKYIDRNTEYLNIRSYGLDKNLYKGG